MEMKDNESKDRFRLDTYIPNGMDLVGLTSSILGVAVTASSMLIFYHQYRYYGFEEEFKTNYNQSLFLLGVGVAALGGMGQFIMSCLFLRSLLQKVERKMERYWTWAHVLVTIAVGTGFSSVAFAGLTNHSVRIFNWICGVDMVLLISIPCLVYNMQTKV